MKTLDQKTAEIKLLMQYAVPPEQHKEALALVEKHAIDHIGLNVFQNFYSYLPEGRDDSIRVLRLLAKKSGAFLLCATTALDDYLYLATTDQAEFLGPLSEGIWDKEILDFFGFKDRRGFIEKHRALDTFPVYVPALLDNTLCPVCHVADGELHTLGCPVEICPWCGGQLTDCSCRFTLLETRRITREKQLDTFNELLHKKGRIPFDAARQSPSYPMTPEDLKPEECE